MCKYYLVESSVGNRRKLVTEKNSGKGNRDTEVHCKIISRNEKRLSKFVYGNCLIDKVEIG